MHSSLLIELRHLDRHFKNQVLLKDFNLEIEGGSFVSLLGASGSGKSTLLRLIAGLDEPSAGQVVVKAQNKGFVFQDANLLPWRNVRENLQLVLELTSLKANIDEYLELVGLSEHATKYPNQLSGGMRMRVSVARALITRPNLLLLDEPFSALDENTRYHLQEELYQIWQQLKMTVVFVTHSISEAVFLSQRAIVLGKKPTQIILDHQVSLPKERDSHLRIDPKYISEIQFLSKHFEFEGLK